MESGKGIAYWVYWGVASLTAAAVGGIVFPWLFRTDLLKLREAIEG